MKFLAFFSLFILPITAALSQSSFYPLGTGDYWVYWEYGQYGGVWDTIRVVTEGDTTLGEKSTRFITIYQAAIATTAPC